MKITFFSNFFNHHQLEVSQEFIKQGIDYTFVATEAISIERLNLGYEDMNKKYNFVLTTYDSKENYNKALKLAVESDIVIMGSAPEVFIQERIKQNKPIFRYSERIFKKGRYRILDPRIIKNLLSKHTKYKNKDIYMLCSSAYTAKDYALAKAYHGKCYKWGYFPPKIEYDINKLLEKKKNEKIKITWVGRFIKWKHPELAIELAEYLKSRACNFQITMIGNGELLEKIKKQILEKALGNNVKILGSMSSNEVRKHMEESNIHIFTSDQNEGWGAVLNEAMNSGCAVVANQKIGSVPYLVEDGVNGFTYKKKKGFFNKVIKLIENYELRKSMSKNAYYTIINTWNAENAVKNFLKLINSKNNEIIEYGPCSKDTKML